MPYLCGFPVIFSLRYFFDSFLSWLIENRNVVFMRFSGYFSLRYFFDFFFSWLIENRNAVFMRFSGYFSLRYFFDSFLSWLIENRNVVFMRFIGCFSLRYLLFFMSVYPILEVNNSWFSSCSLTSRSFLTAACVPGSAALYAACMSFLRFFAL